MIILASKSNQLIQISIKGKSYWVNKVLPIKYKCYKGKNHRFRRYEIICSLCNHPKEILEGDLIRGTALYHNSCRQKKIYNYSNRQREESVAKYIRANYINGKYKTIAGRKVKIEDVHFELTLDQIISLIFSNCYYCGIPPQQIYRYHKNRPYNGIDRVDSNKGYIMSNCVPACGKCNRSKMAMTKEEFYEWLDRIARHNGYTKMGG